MSAFTGYSRTRWYEVEFAPNDSREFPDRFPVAIREMKATPDDDGIDPVEFEQEDVEGPL